MIVEKCNQILLTIQAYQQKRLPECELSSFELSEEFIFDNLIEYPHIIGFIRTRRLSTNND